MPEGAEGDGSLDVGKESAGVFHFRFILEYGGLDAYVAAEGCDCIRWEWYEAGECEAPAAHGDDARYTICARRSLRNPTKGIAAMLPLFFRVPL